jgi:hypothetical protein
MVVGDIRTIQKKVLLTGMGLKKVRRIGFHGQNSQRQDAFPLRHVASWRRNLDGKKAGGCTLIQWKSNYIEKFLFCWWGSVYLFQEVYCKLLQLTLFLLVCQWPFLIISSDIKLLVGGLEHEWFFHNILGMSSSPLTQLPTSIIFQRGRYRLNHQAVFIEVIGLV